MNITSLSIDFSEPYIRHTEAVGHKVWNSNCGWGSSATCMPCWCEGLNYFLQPSYPPVERRFAGASDDHAKILFGKALLHVIRP